MTLQCCRRTERQFCVPRQEVCFHLSGLGQLPHSTLSSRDKREQNWMSDWNQSGRLFPCVGESFLNPDFAFLFWTDFLHLLFINSQQRRRNTAAVRPLEMPGLADFCQRSLVQTGPEPTDRFGAAGFSWHCHIMLLQTDFWHRVVIHCGSKSV